MKRARSVTRQDHLNKSQIFLPYQSSDSFSIRPSHKISRERQIITAIKKTRNRNDYKRTTKSFMNEISKKRKYFSKNLQMELDEMKRERAPFCTYITSYRINKELDKTKNSFLDDKEISNIECIRNLVSLNTRRLNLQQSQSFYNKNKNICIRNINYSQ